MKLSSFSTPSLLLLLALVLHQSSAHHHHTHQDKNAGQDGSSNSSNIWMSSEIVPDIIHAAPTKGILNLQYGDLSVNLGNVLTRTEAFNPPKVSYEADPKAFYTLAMLDPDAPSRAHPIYRSFLHWLVVNIPGANVEAGQTLAEYRPPNPGNGSSFHRYVFLLYEQPGGVPLTFDEKVLPADGDRRDRVLWSIEKFIKKYKMGSASIFGNFFQTEFHP